MICVINDFGNEDFGFLLEIDVDVLFGGVVVQVLEECCWFVFQDCICVCECYLVFCIEFSRE